MIIGVIGSGSMGIGIAQVAATAGCQVLLYDKSEQATKKSWDGLVKIMGKLVARNKFGQEKADSILGNIEIVKSLDAFSTCEFIIEAIIENTDIKKSVFKSLESLISDQCIVASNTSSLSITSLAASLDNPGRFLGVHFFNPAPVMKLVEIVPAIQTEAAVVIKVRDIITDWQKLTVLAKDTPGFIVNKVARPFYGESLQLLSEGIADIATIDWAMTEIGGFRMGPFTLMDFIGHDVNYIVSESVFKAFYYDSRYKPSFTQKRLVEAGYNGRKSGRGFYDYSEHAEKPSPSTDPVLGQYVVDRIVAMLINEAADTLHYQIATKEDIDIAMTKGVNYPRGLFLWADEIGIPECVTSMDDLYDEYRDERYRCSPLLRKMAKKGHSFY